MTRFRLAASFSAVVSLLLLAGCGAGRYPYSLDPQPVAPAPLITIAPTSLTFTAVSGQTSPAQNVVLGNIGNATLNIAGISVNASEYTLTNGCASTLAPGSNCTLSITFTAPNAGVSSFGGSITIVDNSNNVANATQTVALSATGTAVPVPIAQLTPATVTFPDTPASGASLGSTVTMANIGTAPLVFAGAPTVTAGFRLITDNCTASGPLAAGASCTYVLTFNPTSVGAQTGTFTVTDNSNNIAGSTQTVALSGNGTAPAPIITINPTSLDFGTQTLSSTTASQSVTIGNIGNATLLFTSITLNDVDDYIETTTCGTTLAAGSICTITVAFNPQNLGSLPSSITLTDNTGNVAGSTQNITLTGTSTAPAAPQAILTPVSQTFPSTASGSTSAAQTITLSNPGTAALTITGISYSITGFNETTTCPTSGVLPVNTTCAFTVTFAPSATGTYNGSVTVTDNAGNVAGSMQTATFSGTGTPNTTSTLVLTPSTPVQFPSTPVGSTSAAQSFTLTNTGGGTATGVSVSITGGTTKSAFADTTSCTATLAGGASCPITVTFTPYAAGTYEAFLTASDSVANSTISTELDASGVAPCTSNLFSPTSISFPTTKVNTTSKTYTSTLTNCGTAPLVISSITLGGTNAANFAETNNCPISPASVAAGGTCTISATFTPAAVASYSATVTVTDNSTTSPQTLPLTGTGTNASVTYQLYQFPDPDFTTKISTGAQNAIYALINSAQSTIDMTMYEMQDNTFTSDLVARCQAGVKVRVLFSQNEVSASQTNYNTLNTSGANCAAEASNTAFTNTHQKTITVDGATTAVMSLNLQTKYYPTTRDFAMIYNDPNDIAAIEATFNQDWAAGTPYNGKQGASDFSYVPSTGTDLIWSPTTAQAAMTNIIANAQHDLLIENEELASSASYIINAMVAACQRGVILHLAMVNQTDYQANYKTLENAGCGVHVYPDTTNGFYIHAKAVIADYGLSTQSVYMGSINYSNASMNQNRELGLYISDPASITQLYTTMTADYNGGTAY